MCNRIKDDVRWYRDNSKNPWDIFRKSIHTRLVEDKADIKLFLNAWKAGMLGKSSDEKADGTTNKKIKWKKYYKKAEKKGIKKTSKNQMGMLDNVYNKKYKKLVDHNIRWKPTYTEKSVEGKDFACFKSAKRKIYRLWWFFSLLTVCIMTISDGLRKSEMQFIIKSEK